LQQVEPSQGGNDLLAHFLSVADAVRDLQVTVGTGGFDAEKHGRAAWVYRQQPRRVDLRQQKRRIGLHYLHYIFDFLTPKSHADPLQERLS